MAISEDTFDDEVDITPSIDDIPLLDQQGEESQISLDAWIGISSP
jgi:hypothetical protein